MWVGAGDGVLAVGAAGWWSRIFGGGLAGLAVAVGSGGAGVVGRRTAPVAATPIA